MNYFCIKISFPFPLTELESDDPNATIVLSISEAEDENLLSDIRITRDAYS